MASGKVKVTEGERAARRNLTVIIIYAVLCTVMVSVSIFALRIPSFAACSIVVLETVLVALLRKTPLFVHILILAAEIAAGVYVKKTVFIILMAAVYVACLVISMMWTRESEKN